MPFQSFNQINQSVLLSFLSRIEVLIDLPPTSHGSIHMSHSKIIAGTDDDLPPPHQNRIPRGGRVAGNGRSAVVGSIPYSRMYGETDMETQIHQLEQEAYSSVLRAFKAQADAITWVLFCHFVCMNLIF